MSISVEVKHRDGVLSGVAVYANQDAAEYHARGLTASTAFVVVSGPYLDLYLDPQRALELARSLDAAAARLAGEAWERAKGD
jgi:hypothetical protein